MDIYLNTNDCNHLFYMFLYLYFNSKIDSTILFSVNDNYMFTLDFRISKNINVIENIMEDISKSEINSKCFKLTISESSYDRLYDIFNNNGFSNLLVNKQELIDNMNNIIKRQF